MDGYGYSYRGYATYSIPTHDGRSVTSYASDHVCRPVIIDAEGRKRPLMFYGPDKSAEQYPTRIDTVVQHVHAPYGASEFKPAGARRTPDPLDGAGTEYHWHKPVSLVNDRPQDINEFLTKVLTEANRPKSSTSTYWRPNSKLIGYDGNPGGSSEYKDIRNQDMLKPSVNTYRNDDHYDDYYRKQSSENEPGMITSGGWVRPSRSVWATPPHSTLSTPTNDINAAIGMLKEAAKPLTAAALHSQVPETIDSKEAERRYGKFNFATRKYENEDNYTATIDSTEAARKYHGTTV